MTIKSDYSPYTDYSRQQLLEIIASQMKKSRFEHCLRVEQKALELAKQEGVEPEKAALVGLIHDYAKERPLKELQEAVISYHLDPVYQEESSAILHGPVGAELIRQELGIHDEEILDAIRQHTIGGFEMTPLAKVLFIADFIEDGRSFDGVQQTRQLAKEDIDLAVVDKLKQTLSFLIEEEVVIFPLMVDIYNHWVTKKINN
ncbi:bis(5'-nucleosyl)-tetraphosphatase (symmetrical) YqeK [Granulicatella seriolae]|uniref:bis(5'-nucleosyl)-tetraphosphatase (symmetrical) n=1 Tax=Granulicatella seriolae TaxID=2967226 RepID=A0ABT1WNJ5_9LACT|nr:bis(5'-nucleosyl)-tetraphosphatase (symmetrical) YqeK [Granulicatella seriolae]